VVDIPLAACRCGRLLCVALGIVTLRLGGLTGASACRASQPLPAPGVVDEAEVGPACGLEDAVAFLGEAMAARIIVQCEGDGDLSGPLLMPDASRSCCRGASCRRWKENSGRAPDGGWHGS
jgi:hypothetical protein